MGALSTTDMIDAVIQRGVNLSTWESEFIEKMETKMETYGDRVRFSERKAEKIEEIYTERVP